MNPDAPNPIAIFPTGPNGFCLSVDHIKADTPSPIGINTAPTANPSRATLVNERDIGIQLGDMFWFRGIMGY